MIGCWGYCFDFGSRPQYGELRDNRLFGVFLMIHVVATIQLADGQRDQFLEHFHQLVPLVHQEQGCIEYGPTVDLETDIGAQDPVREQVVTVMEKWESLAALQAHLVAPHMLEYRARVKELVQETKIQVLTPVAPVNDA